MRIHGGRIYTIQKLRYIRNGQFVLDTTCGDHFPFRDSAMLTVDSMAVR